MQILNCVYLTVVCGWWSRVQNACFLKKKKKLPTKYAIYSNSHIFCSLFTAHFAGCCELKFDLTVQIERHFQESEIVIWFQTTYDCGLDWGF